MRIAAESKKIANETKVVDFEDDSADWQAVSLVVIDDKVALHGLTVTNIDLVPQAGLH